MDSFFVDHDLQGSLDRFCHYLATRFNIRGRESRRILERIESVYREILLEINTRTPLQSAPLRSAVFACVTRQLRITRWDWNEVLLRFRYLGIFSDYLLRGVECRRRRSEIQNFVNNVNDATKAIEEIINEEEG